MATTTTKIRRRRAPGPRYFELVRACPLRPIETDAEHDRALAMIDSIIDIKTSKRSRDEEDYLDVLSDLVIAYEAKHYPDPPADPPALLRGYMADKGFTLTALAKASGLGKSTLSEISSGKRPMTRKHMELIGKALHIPPSVFLD